MKAFISVTQPYRWAWLDDNDKVVDQGIAEDIKSIQFPDLCEAVVGVAPLPAVGIVHSKLPTSSLKKAQEIAGYSIEDYIAEDIDDVHVAIIDWQPNEESMLAVVDKEKMRHWIHDFQVNDIQFNALYPAQSLLPQHDSVDATVVFIGDGAYVRANDEFSYLDLNLLPAWLSEFGKDQVVALTAEGKIEPKDYPCEFRLWPIGDNFVDWLNNSETVDLGQDLLVGEFKPASKYTQFPNWYQTKLAVAIALLLAFLPPFLSYFGATIQEFRVNSKAKAAIEYIDSTAEIGDDAVEQLRQLIFTAQANAADYGGYAYVITRLGTVFPPNQGSIVDMDFSEGGLTVLVDAPSLASVNAIQTALQSDNEINTEVLNQQNVQGKASAVFRIRPKGI